jgi:AcrR family transcriptional regulator
MSEARSRKPRGQGHERRAEILAAAKAMFIAEGYATVTTRKLAERVGISQTGLYVYFQSKEEILYALSQATFAKLGEALRTAIEGVAPGPELLRRLARAYIEFGLANRDEYELTFMASDAPLKPFHEDKDLTRPFDQQGVGLQAYLIVAEQVRRLQAAGAIAEPDPAIATQTIWVALHGLVALLIARSGFPWADTRLLTDSLVETLVRGLGPR